MVVYAAALVYALVAWLPVLVENYEKLANRHPNWAYAYLGAVMPEGPNGWLGASWTLGAIFLPSFLLVVGALPFWDLLRWRPSFQAALRGINAAVVGFLLAALYDPIWTSAVAGPADFALALIAFGLLVLWRLPAWLVVPASALTLVAVLLSGLFALRSLRLIEPAQLLR